MDLLKAIEMASEGMRAQGTRMKVISENMANAETTGKNASELPYQRQLVTFKNVLDRTSKTRHVKVDEITKDKSDFILKYDPAHPAADARGYVKMPNVNTLVEMMDMREAQRAYEANLSVIDNTRTMMARTVDLLKR